jgi:hypothetical protein
LVPQAVALASQVATARVAAEQAEARAQRSAAQRNGSLSTRPSPFSER